MARLAGFTTKVEASVRALHGERRKCWCCLCENTPRCEPKARTRYWDKPPGYGKAETRRMFKRLTLREHLEKICTHTPLHPGKDVHGRAACAGWNRKAWSWHEQWRRDVALQK